MTSRVKLAEIRHFLYPLNPESAEGYVFIGASGAELPTSYEGFLEALDYGEPDEWGLATGHRKVSTGDFIWAYFVKPDGAIRAVGRAQHGPHWNEGWGRWAIRIQWDRALIDRLAKSPIRYEDYRQRVQGAVNEANASTLAVLQTWLDHNQHESDGERDTTVGFVRQEVEARLGQREFRLHLMKAYGNRCAISGCDVETVLQAAHIRGVGDEGDHSVSNGLLLRADLHNLFDNGLVWIASDLTVRVAPELLATEYRQYEGKKLNPTLRSQDRPSKAALRRHRSLHGR